MQLILQFSKRNRLYEKLAFDSSLLPEEIKEFLNKKYSSIDERSKAFLGFDLEAKSCVEYFSNEDEVKLSDPTVGENIKDSIYWYRRRYLQEIGVVIDKKPSEFENNKKFYEYCIEQEHIKALIPPKGLAKDITKLRTKAYEEFQKEFIYGSQDFIENSKRVGDIPSNKEKIYKNQKDKKICVTGGRASDKKNISILFFTIKREYCGMLDYLFLHEVGHGIDAEYTLEMGYRSGFDRNVGVNPYNSQKRKYERLNETLTDIFAIEAIQVLRERDIYIFEPKEICKNSNDCNTHSIVKALLTTLLDRYREPIVRAKLFGDMKGLYAIIGEENFEELNDVVNKVDSLEGLVQKLEDNQTEEPVVVEYHKQLERLERIYASMEYYKSKDVSNDILRSAISATEEKTRTGQINDLVNNITQILQKDSQQEQDDIEYTKN